MSPCRFACGFYRRQKQVASVSAASVSAAAVIHTAMVMRQYLLQTLTIPVLQVTYPATEKLRYVWYCGVQLSCKHSQLANQGTEFRANQGTEFLANQRTEFLTQSGSRISQLVSKIMSQFENRTMSQSVNRIFEPIREQNFWANQGAEF